MRGVGAALLLGSLWGCWGSADPASSSASLVFVAEDVHLEIGADSLEVRGSYKFSLPRPGARLAPLFYPYPVDSLLGAARTVELAFRIPGSEWSPLKYEEIARPPGVRWLLPELGADTLEVRTIYRQAKTATYARYIVTTTGSWGRALRHARFTVQLPEGAARPRFSHNFVRADPERPSLYVFTAEDFFPARDLVVRWESSESGL